MLADVHYRCRLRGLLSLSRLRSVVIARRQISCPSFGIGTDCGFEPRAGHLKKNVALSLRPSGASPVETLIGIRAIIFSYRHDTGPKCVAP